MARGNCTVDCNKSWHILRSRRRNQSYKFLCRSLRPFRSYTGSKFGVSHRKREWVLTLCLARHALARDYMISVIRFLLCTIYGWSLQVSVVPRLNIRTKSHENILKRQFLFAILLELSTLKLHIVNKQLVSKSGFDGHEVLLCRLKLFNSNEL